jgi:hypothetical protein
MTVISHPCFRGEEHARTRSAELWAARRVNRRASRAIAARCRRRLLWCLVARSWPTTERGLTGLGSVEVARAGEVGR